MKPIALALLFLAPAAFAQSADPTRPPANWLAPPAVDGQAGDAMAGGLRLQSVLLPQGGKPLAIISGKTVQVGERIDGATLVRLSEHQAVLQGADGVTHLYMTPDVQKQMIVTRSTRKTSGVGQVKGLP